MNGSAVLRRGTPRGTLPALCGRALAKIGGTLAGTLAHPAAQLWKGKKSNKRKQSKEEKETSLKREEKTDGKAVDNWQLTVDSGARFARSGNARKATLTVNRQ